MHIYYNFNYLSSFKTQATYYDFLISDNETHRLVMESSRRWVPPKEKILENDATTTSQNFSIDELSQILRDLTTMEEYMDQNLENFLKNLKSRTDEMGYDWNGEWRSLIEEEEIKGMKFEEVIELLMNMMDRNSKGMPKYILLNTSSI